MADCRAPGILNLTILEDESDLLTSGKDPSDIVRPRPNFMLWGFISLKGVNYNIMQIFNDYNLFFLKPNQNKIILKMVYYN